MLVGTWSLEPFQAHKLKCFKSSGVRRWSWSISTVLSNFAQQFISLRSGIFLYFINQEWSTPSPHLETDQLSAEAQDGENKLIKHICRVSVFVCFFFIQDGKLEPEFQPNHWASAEQKNPCAECSQTGVMPLPMLHQQRPYYPLGEEVGFFPLSCVPR